jgi:hypothetical protein
MGSVTKVYMGQWWSFVISHSLEAVSQEHEAVMESSCDDSAVKC